MKEIATFYKAKIPTLKRVKVKSDGQVQTRSLCALALCPVATWSCHLTPVPVPVRQRAQYKGRKNFGPMALWPHPADVPADTQCFCMANSASCGREILPGLGIEMYHDFPPSHHGSGPVDKYGKDAPKGMDRDTKFNKLDRYNFEHCYNWSVKNMGEPTDKPGKFDKTWSATGYQWRAYTDGSQKLRPSFQPFQQTTTGIRSKVPTSSMRSVLSTRTNPRYRRSSFPATAMLSPVHTVTSQWPTAGPWRKSILPFKRSLAHLSPLIATMKSKLDSQ